MTEPTMIPDADFILFAMIWLLTGHVGSVQGHGDQLMIELHLPASDCCLAKRVGVPRRGGVS